ncbi:ParA family protein [Dermabacteraceae bacterium P7074]
MFTLSVCSLKGGVGKTSVTLGLASAALHRGIDTLVLDLDPQGDTTLGLLGSQVDGLDVAEVVASARTETIERAIRPTPWALESKTRLDMIPGSFRSGRLDSPTPTARTLRRLREALMKRRTEYGMVLIDCPPSLNGLTQMGLTASDSALVVSEPGIYAVSAADRAFKLISELREQGHAPELELLGIAVNRFRPRSVEHAFRLNELRERYGNEMIVNPVIEERVGLQQAQGSAVPLHKYQGASGPALAAQFDQLLDTVLRNRDEGFGEEPVSRVRPDSEA